MSEHDDTEGLAIDWQAYEVPAAPAGAVAAIVASVERGGPPVMASAPRAAGAGGRRGAWLAAGAAALVLAAAAAVLVLMSRGDDGDDRSAEPAVVPDRDQPREDKPDPRKEEETWSRRFTSPEQRRALQRAIEQARVRRAGGGPGDVKEPNKDGRRIGKPMKTVPGGGLDSEKVGVLDKEYIRSVVKDALPLLRECYELALETDPHLSGRLVVDFTIVGEPDVGGLVNEATTTKEGIGANQELSECVRETMLSLEFPAPEGGGIVQVKYPFAFSSDGEPPPDPPATPPEPTKPPFSAKKVPPKVPWGTPSPKDKPFVPPLGSGPPPVDLDEDGDDAPDDKQAPEPVAKNKKAAELTAEAREAARSGNWGNALRLCETAAAKDRGDQDNAMVCALAACNVQDGAKAKLHMDRLKSPSRKGMAVQTCKKNGVEIPID